MPGGRDGDGDALVRVHHGVQAHLQPIIIEYLIYYKLSFLKDGGLKEWEWQCTICMRDYERYAVLDPGERGKAQIYRHENIAFVFLILLLRNRLI